MSTYNRVVAADENASLAPTVRARLATDLSGTFVARNNIAGTATPWIIPHKGGLAVAPEHTDEAYRASLASGFKWLDLDLNLLADGSLANHHDSTVDAITTSTGNTADFTPPEWLNLKIDAGTWFAPAWPLDMHTTLGVDVLRRFSTTGVFIIENKSSGYMQKTVDAILDEGLQKSAILSGANLSDLADATAAGIAAGHITNTPDAAAMLAAGVEYAIISIAVADSIITDAVTAGLKVIVWNVATRVAYARGLSLGAIGFYCDDPEWVSGGGETGKADFTQQTWLPGMTIGVGSRGAFIGSGKWSPVISSGDNATLLMGPLCKATPATTYTLAGSIFFDAYSASAGATVGVHICEATDDPYKEQVGGATYLDGYLVNIDGGGTLKIFRTDSSNNTKTMVAGLAGVVATADGTEAKLEITVTPTTITAVVTNGLNTTPIVATDSAYRGGYVHTTHLGLAGTLWASFKGWTRV